MLGSRSNAIINKNGKTKCYTKSRKLSDIILYDKFGVTKFMLTQNINFIRQALVYDGNKKRLTIAPMSESGRPIWQYENLNAEDGIFYVTAMYRIMSSYRQTHSQTLFKKFCKMGDNKNKSITSINFKYKYNANTLAVVLVSKQQNVAHLSDRQIASERPLVTRKKGIVVVFIVIMLLFLFLFCSCTFSYFAIS